MHRVRSVPALRLSRRHLGVLGAATAGALAACTPNDSVDPDPGGDEVTGGPAVTAYTGGIVHTVDDSMPWATAFAFDGNGTIIAVGSDEDVLAASGSAPQVVDLAGGFVLPGFQDAHLHAPEAGINAELCVVDPDLGLEGYADQIADCAAEQQDSDWVRIAGASLFNLRDTVENPIDVLDEIISDRPVLILDDLGHAAWVNSVGLEAAGIDEDDPDPPGGILHRHTDGRLTGLLLENAQQVARDAAAVSLDVAYAGLLATLRRFGQEGVTAVSDAGGYWSRDFDQTWTRAAEAGELTVRAVNGLYVYPDIPLDEQVEELSARFRDDRGSLLRTQTAKIYVDGILDLGTALVSGGYIDPPDPNHPAGFAYFDGTLIDTVDALHQAGFTLHVHVIGDDGVSRVLDAIEAINDTPTGIAERRHRLTHTYMVAPGDERRFVDLGVIADFQVGIVSTDPAYHEDLTAIIGQRAFDLIPVARLLDAGADVSLSSDWDADELGPLATIQRCLLRADNAVPDIETAIRLVTIAPAYALHHDDITGSITVGKQADFVVLDTDITAVATDQIDRARVVQTVVDGVVVFDG